MRCLVVKMSSLGDLIYTLPALSDAKHAQPDLDIDWVVEAQLSKIPSWHADVKRIIPIQLRRWRRHPWQAYRSGEWQAWRSAIRAHEYDLVIDAQGLLKSAWIGRFARSKATHGYTAAGCRESLAHLFYQHRHPVSWQQHAATRMRELFARSLGYVCPTTDPNYGIDQQRLTPYPIDGAPIMLIHGSAKANKCWPVSHWIALGQALNDAGHALLLPWGNDIERRRAEHIAKACPQATVLPKLSLSEIAHVLTQLKAFVGLDTGLSHLGAALNVPGVTLYGPTDPTFIGTFGPKQRHLATFRSKTGQPTSNVKQSLIHTIAANAVHAELQTLLSPTSI